jgi:hypothetical protein
MHVMTGHALSWKRSSRQQQKLLSEFQGGSFPEDHACWPKDFENHLSSGLNTAIQERDKLLLRQRKV